jgi:hypothetical protein
MRAAMPGLDAARIAPSPTQARMTRITRFWPERPTDAGFAARRAHAIAFVIGLLLDERDAPTRARLWTELVELLKAPRAPRDTHP